jgi:hypothetical protein
MALIGKHLLSMPLERQAPHLRLRSFPLDIREDFYHELYQRHHLHRRFLPGLPHCVSPANGTSGSTYVAHIKNTGFFIR